MAINYLLEIDMVKVNGNTREKQTLRLSALILDPMVSDKFYAARISAGGLPTITKSIQNIFYGKSSRNYGYLKIENSDGKFNYLIKDKWTLSNRPCRIKKGEQNQPYSSYTDYTVGKTGVVSFDHKTITIEFTDSSINLDTIPHIDKENVVSTVKDTVESIIKAASITADNSVATWLSTYGSNQVLLNFKDQKLGEVLNQIITPLRSYYFIDNNDKIYIKQIKLFNNTDTPVRTLDDRKVLVGYSRNSLKRHYWRVGARRWEKKTGETQYTTKTIKAKDALDVNGAAVSLSGGDNTGIPVSSHNIIAGDSVRIYEDDVYQGEYVAQPATTANQVVINKTYESHTFDKAIIRNTVQYPFAEDNYDVGGLFTNETEAQAAADNWLEFLKEPLVQYQVSTKNQLFDETGVNIGDHLRLNLDQPYGTVDATIISLAYSIGSNLVAIGAIANE